MGVDEKVVHFIRHGQSTANLAQLQWMEQQGLSLQTAQQRGRQLREDLYRLMDQHPDSPLTAEGCAEAERTR